MEGPQCDQQLAQVLLPKTSRAAVHQWLVAFHKLCLPSSGWIKNYSTIRQTSFSSCFTVTCREVCRFYRRQQDWGPRGETQSAQEAGELLYKLIALHIFMSVRCCPSCKWKDCDLWCGNHWNLLTKQDKIWDLMWDMCIKLEEWQQKTRATSYSCWD